MKGYKSVGVTKHKTPANHRDQARQHHFRQKNRHASTQVNRFKSQQQKSLLTTTALPLGQEAPL